MGKEHKQESIIMKYKTAQGESQEDSSVLADGHQAVLNKANKKSRKPEGGHTVSVVTAEDVLA